MTGRGGAGAGPEAWDAPLVPVRRALAEGAARRADALLARARHDADAVLADAAVQAAEVVARARAEGARVGREQAALEAARSRREAHRTVLAARAAARDDLARRVAAAAVDLRTDPRYPGLRDRLAGECRARLGAGAQVVEAPEGGVVGRSGSRRLDLSLPVLAALAAAEALDPAPEAGADLVPDVAAGAAREGGARP